VRVHHVDVDHVGVLGHQVHLVGEMREVGREDRGGELAHRARF
jgi:hypothetical protein